MESIAHALKYLLTATWKNNLSWDEDTSLKQLPVLLCWSHWAKEAMVRMSWKQHAKLLCYDSKGYEKKVIMIGMKDYEVRAIEGFSGENIPVFWPAISYWGSMWFFTVTDEMFLKCSTSLDISVYISKSFKSYNTSVRQTPRQYSSWRWVNWILERQ